MSMMEIIYDNSYSLKSARLHYTAKILNLELSFETQS